MMKTQHNDGSNVIVKGLVEQIKPWYRKNLT